MSISTACLISFIFLIPFTGLGIFLIHRSLQDLNVRAQYASLKWPKIDGVVLNCDITEGAEDYWVSVKYEYIVNGSRYLGSDTHTSGSRKGYETGSSIGVRYDPTQPGLSRIWFDWNYAMVPGCGFIITLAGIGAIGFWFILFQLLP